LNLSLAFAYSEFIGQFLLVGVLTFGLCWLVVLTTRWHGAYSLDGLQGVQKLHMHAAPRIGGLPIVLALLLIAFELPPPLQNLLLPWLFAGSIAFAFGLAEDLTKRVGIRSRLLATITSGVAAWFLTGYSLSSVNIVGIDWLLQFPVLSVILTAFAVGGLANAVNIIDGLNGLASSMVIWAMLGIATLAAGLGDTTLAGICILFIACSLGFFFVNWPWGRIFLGDGGAYFLGFSLAWACVLLVERNAEVSAFAGLLLCIHPISEVAYSALRRHNRRHHPAHPDRLHFHSLVKRRIMWRLLPNSSKVTRNSVGGIAVGSMSIVPAILVQFIYHDTLMCIAAVFVISASYVLLYKRMVIRFGT
jgi:UDP-N-acetylmuramyl pentapeptide phosphotransferase/UDP-N-acetylglucosamine-1-phosphate transferase